jgi:nitrilase
MPAEPFTAAIVQRPPVLLDRAASTERVVAGVAEVAAAGARLAVFPETYLPGYPEYIWRLSPGNDYDLSREIHARLLDQAVDVAAGDLDAVRDAARISVCTIVLGIHERDAEFSRATLFNTVVTIGPDGDVLNRHRKLVPTNPERMVWSPGDGAGLRVLDTPVGRLGGLICWENYMPLARFTLYAQGVEVYVAPTWDEGDEWVASMRHIAREGRCWVLGAGCSIPARDSPSDFPDRARLYPDEDEWLNPGDSVIVQPGGQIVAGPLRGEHGVLTALIDPAESRATHYTLDAAGHYNRPDVFQVRVDRTRRRQVVFDEQPASQAGGGADVLEL